MTCFRLLLILLGFTTALQAQPYYFRHYQVENGLSNNTVFCSIQDQHGFVWFGTKDGLNRFDGYRFKVFTVSSDDETNFTGNEIYALATDRQGVLWVGSQEGLFRFDEKKEKLIPFLDRFHDVYRLHVDRDNQLWFISGSTFYRYNFEKGQLIDFPSARDFNTTSMCQLEDGRMCFSTTNGYLKILDSNNRSFYTHDVFAHSPAPASRWIAKITSGKGDIVYVGTSSQGLKQFSASTLDYTDLITANSDKTTIYVRDIITTATNEVWVATESGIFILHTDNNRFTNLKKKFNNPYTLSDNAVYTLCKDNEGGVWAGTFFGGLNYFHRQNFAFEKYFPDRSENSVSGNAVREICEDGDGNLWIGTEDAGLNKLDIQTGKFTHFQPSGLPTSVAYSNIHGLLVDGKNLWIGTFEHGLDILDIRSEKVIRHYNAGAGPFDLKSNFIVTLLKTKSGDIYVGTSSSLAKRSPKNDGFAPVAEVQDGTFISALLEDSNGIIWVGTHGRGMFYFNPLSGEKGQLLNDPANQNSLATNTINALYEDNLQNLWISTEGGGLCRLNKNRQVFTRYTTKNGLPSNFVFKALEDKTKNLWVTTSKGLVKLEQGTGRLNVYTKSNGLLNDQFNYNSGYRDANGKLYFGSVRGMITFDPGEFHPINFVPPVFITGIQVHNKELQVSKDSSVLQKSIVLSDTVRLAYQQSSVSIDFAALSFISPEVTAYSYKLQGLEKDWTLLNSNRKVYFTNLEPGTYTFRLKAAVNGVWSKEEKKLTIIIAPPFWATPWAYLLYLLAGGVLLYYLIGTYHKMLMNKKEKDIYEAKIEFFTNIAHEIKTPLTLINGPLENLSELKADYPEIKDDVATMERSTVRLVNLVNQILDFRQTETKGFSLAFSTVQINDLLRDVYITFEPYAKKRTLQFTLELPSKPLAIQADDEALTKIFSNLFSNAVKYADKEVHVCLRAPNKKENNLRIEIRNDGYLIPLEMRERIFEPFYRLKQSTKQPGTGIGLALARSLVKLHNGKLFMEDSAEGMNIFVVCLPYVYQRGRKRIQQEIHNNIP